MPAYFLSQNVIDSISWKNKQIQHEQEKDPLIKTLKIYLLKRELLSALKLHNVV
jgi:hypothetical protein